MAEIYLRSTLMWNASLEDMFSFIYRNGLDGMELWAQHWFEKYIPLRSLSGYPHFIR